MDLSPAARGILATLHKVCARYQTQGQDQPSYIHEIRLDDLIGANGFIPRKSIEALEEFAKGLWELQFWRCIKIDNKGLIRGLLQFARKKHPLQLFSAAAREFCQRHPSGEIDPHLDTNFAIFLKESHPLLAATPIRLTQSGVLAYKRTVTVPLKYAPPSRFPGTA